MSQLLYEAVVRRDAAVMSELLEAGHDPNVTTIGGDTPLRLAAGRGLCDLMQQLIDAGADLNGADLAGARAILRAAAGGHVECVRRLIDHGADVHAQTAPPHALTPLHAAVRSKSLETVRVLLRAGADINARDGSGQTVLVATVQCPEHYGPELIELLFDAGADPNAADNLGQTATHFAARRPQTLQVVLSRGGKADVRDKKGRTPMHLAAERSIPLLLAAGADPAARDEAGDTPLRALLRKSALVVMLLEMNVEPINALGADGKSLLYLAAESHGHNQNVLARLLAAGADPNSRGPGGKTAAHLVVPYGDPGGLRVLLDYGADPHARDDQGETPLHVASRTKYGAACAMLLLERGARAEVASANGETPLHLAAECYCVDVVRALLAAGADPNAATTGPLPPGIPFAKMSIAESRRVATARALSADRAGQTPLHRVARVSLERQYSGWIPDDAADGVAGREAAGEIGASLVKTLVAAGADVNAADQRGVTALHHAVRNANVVLALALLAAGANSEQKDDSGQSPREIATQLATDPRTGTIMLDSTLCRILRQMA